MIIYLDKFSSTHRKEWSLCPYHRQKKIEKEKEEKKRIINGSDKYKYRVAIMYPNLVYWYIEFKSSLCTNRLG